MIPDPLEIASIHAGFRNGGLTPVQLAETLLDRIDRYQDKAVFIHRIPPATVLAAAAAIDLTTLDTKPLLGIPFVVKDNMDVAGAPTTAGCPDFAYTAPRDAVCIARLRAAGAILLAKANMDQFATGLNGTRSPYGAPRSVLNNAYISGGSSSGSAVAVGAGLAVFALGTDTAGSGRIPAAFNNLIGLKPTFGRIPSTGIVPACQTLDCVSIFANATADALQVLAIAEGADPGDAYSTPPQTVLIPQRPRIGILRPADQDFAGDAASAALYAATLTKAAALGWDLREIDYTPLRDLAAALYGTAYIAERLEAVRPFYEASPAAIYPVIRTILDNAASFTAADAFSALHQVQALRRHAETAMANVDLLLLPTAPTIFTVAQMLAEPITANAKLGIYTNFVNFMGLAAIAVPAGFRPDGLPFGVSLIGPGFSEAALAPIADALHRAAGAGAGKTKAEPKTQPPSPPLDQITLVVAGAHLSGMVLNHELLAAGATLVTTARTTPDYKMFALLTTPPKPGLVRAPGFAGPGIEVELWSLPAAGFANFVAALPPPMGIGKVTLADGTEHPGFLCEPHALHTARDITEFAGWRAYRAEGLTKPNP